MDVGRVGIHPEVVAVGVAVEMEPQPVPADLNDNTNHQVNTRGGDAPGSTAPAREADGKSTVIFKPN